MNHHITTKNMFPNLIKNTEFFIKNRHRCMLYVPQDITYNPDYYESILEMLVSSMPNGREGSRSSIHNVFNGLMWDHPILPLIRFISEDDSKHLPYTTDCSYNLYELQDLRKLPKYGQYKIINIIKPSLKDLPWAKFETLTEFLTDFLNE